MLAVAACSEGPLSGEGDAGHVTTTARALHQQLGLDLDQALELRPAAGGFTAVNLPAPPPAPASGWTQPGPHRIEARLPARADGVTRLRSGPVTLEITPLGASDAPCAPEEQTLVCRGAFPSADSYIVAQEQRVEEFIRLHDARAPRSFTYHLRVVGDGRVEQRGGTVQALDREGNAWLRLAPPVLVDAAGKRWEADATLHRDRLTITLPSGAREYPILLDPGWTTTGSASCIVGIPYLETLPSGKVVGVSVCGKSNCKNVVTHLYDEKTGTWTATGMGFDMRNQGTSTLLPSGKVLLAGGSGSRWTGSYCTMNQDLKSAEVFDPTSGKWSFTSNMTRVRLQHTATRLSSGKVLVVGGRSSIYSSMCNAETELYDEATKKWTNTGKLNEGRCYHKAVRLASGKVLVIGGYSNSKMQSSCELYDPKTAKWTTTGSLKTARIQFGTARLKNGKVLVAGGRVVAGGTLASAELYDPATGKWSATGSMAYARYEMILKRLKSGKVLAMAGNSSDTTELYDASKGTWSLTGKLNSKHTNNNAAALLPSGKVLFVAPCGGQTCNGTSEIYNPTSGISCSSAASCISGHCVDGICCQTACTTPCMRCQAVNGVGTCSGFILANKPDTNSSPACTSTKACDGKGACKLALAQKCSTNGQCASGLCADGVCCDTACTDTCKACNLAGKAGTCSFVAVEGTDASAASPCLAPKACDGNGACKLARAEKCAGLIECATGHCADGRCCDEGCLGTCKACNLPGKLGTCSLIPAGGADAVATAPCTSTKACDGKGKCLTKQGQNCTASSQCLTGHCQDLVCCGSACKDTCKGCNVAGNKGACVFIPTGQTDPFATTPCTGTKVCDGAGGCKSSGVAVCKKNSDCLSGHCSDGLCCKSACKGTCKSCAVSGSLGSCVNIPLGKPDLEASVLCSGNNVCDGLGGCKLALGKSCNADGDCASGSCSDGYCCDSACTVACKSCGLPGKQGTCSNIGALLPDNAPSGACAGNNACDGQGQCLKAPGQPCFLHTQCATGSCKHGVCCTTSCDQKCKTCALSGSAGKCMDVPANSDPNKDCPANYTCDGAGSCKKKAGQTCTSGAGCVSGHCVDGYCCDSACTATCKSCGLTGKAGTCSNLPAGTPDLSKTGGCSGTKSCDGAGNCKLANGQSCVSGAKCGSGHCVDGNCCDIACKGDCLTCASPANPGTCAFVAAGKPDYNATKPCTGTSACNGKGTCLKGNGQACMAGYDCGSGHCVDGKCCDQACTATCSSCAVKGKEGTCSLLPAGSADSNATKPCSGKQACDSSGQCKAAVGQTCKANADCATATCVDKVCCATACGKNCMSCNLTGSVGTCSFDLKGTDPGNDCIGKDPSCGGACDGSGKCTFPGIGNGCGKCKACDGTGRCSKTPSDDTKCGVIDCDKLDTKCKDYHDLKASRCDSFGACKAPNTKLTCTKFTDLCTKDAGQPDRSSSPDAGSKNDRGANTADLKVQQPPPDGGSEGCSVSRTDQPAQALLSALFALLLLVSRRRRIESR